MAYVNGNLALQPKRKPDRKESYKVSKKTVVKKKSIPVQEKLLFLFTIVVFVIVAFVIISRSAEIYELNLKVKDQTRQYEAMQVQLKELEKQVQALDNPSYIGEVSREWGYVQADENDTIKVTHDKSAPVAMNKD